MTDFLKSIANDLVSSIASGASKQVVHAIQNASEKSGVDFAYLLQQAKAESSFNADAEAKTSSASGLYQFIESTWLTMVDRFGDKYGIDPNANEEEILNLRKDPDIASHMAAEFAGENKRYLDRNWGGDAGATELYFAHFLGAGQASSFLKAHDDNPLQSAAALFPKAAEANKAVFYDKGTGRAKSLAEVYTFFDQKFQNPAQETQKTAPIPNDPNRIANNATDKRPQYRITPIDQDSVFNQRKPVQPQSHAQGLVFNQLDLIMLTQIELPTSKIDSKTAL